MTFDEWKKRLSIELAECFKMTPTEATQYIEDTGPSCWIEMFNDGSTPKEAAAEEAWAAMWAGD